MDIDEILEFKKEKIKELKVDEICSHIISKTISYKKKRKDVIGKIKFIHLL